MSTDPSQQNKRTALAVGAVLVLPVLCCALPLLIAAGLAGFGTVLGNLWVIGAAVALLVGALFFSVECGSCGPTAQALAQAQQTGGETANFVAVDIAGYETDADVKGFLTANNAVALAYAIDTDAQWVRTYQVSQISMVVVLDDAGKEVFRAVEPIAETITTELAKVTA